MAPAVAVLLSVLAWFFGQTAKSTHHPHKIDDQHRECKTGGGAYFAFFLGSNNSHTTPPKIPPDEEGLFRGSCVVRDPLFSHPELFCIPNSGAHSLGFSALATGVIGPFGPKVLWSGRPPNSTETQKDPQVTLMWPKSDSKLLSGSHPRVTPSDPKVTQKWLESRREAFLLTVGAFLLTVKLLCLQSLEALVRRTFPL